jgi:TIR domain/NACHT domain/PBS lyase HEAT-like repeat
MASDKHIFISYARRDCQAASARLASNLEQAGFGVWRDSRAINSAQDFTSQIEHGIASASYVVACITNDTLRGDSFVRREIGWACLSDIPILTARFQDVLPPVSIATNTFIEFFKDWDAAFDQLCAALSTTSSPTNRRRDVRSSDPHYEYVSALYRDIVRYLDQTVFSLIPLRSTSKGDSVEKTVSSLPIGFFRRALSVEPKRTEEPEERFDGLAEPFNAFGERMLILGEPGSGKTTSLFAFARDALALRLEDPSQPLPLLAPISEWRTDKESQSLADWLVDLFPTLDAVSLRQLVDSGGALLLLDGLDEIARSSHSAEDSSDDKQHEDPRARFLKQLSARGPIVLTCRAAEYRSIGEKAPLGGAVELQPLDDSQLKEYLREFPALWGALQRDEELRNVARTPLLLSILTFAFAGMKENAQALAGLSRESLRDRIFDTYVSRRYEHESLKNELTFSLEDLYRTLGEAATAEVLSNIPTITSSIHDLEGARAEEFIEQASRLNLLIRGPLDRLRFVHLLLRDHFVARLNRARLQADDPKRFDRAALALGRIGDEASIPTLIGFLESLPPASEDLGRETTRGKNVFDALISYPVDTQHRVADGVLESAFDKATVSLDQARAILDRLDIWEVGSSLGSAARMGSIERRKRVIDFIKSFTNHVPTNVLPGLFPDPDVGEYALNAVETMSGSAANMALDRWEEYQRRQGG